MLNTRYTISLELPEFIQAENYLLEIVGQVASGAISTSDAEELLTASIQASNPEAKDLDVVVATQVKPTALSTADAKTPLSYHQPAGSNLQVAPSGGIWHLDRPVRPDEMFALYSSCTNTEYAAGWFSFNGPNKLTYGGQDCTPIEWLFSKFGHLILEAIANPDHEEDRYIRGSEIRPSDLECNFEIHQTKCSPDGHFAVGPIVKLAHRQRPAVEGDPDHRTLVRWSWA